jgi:hypothetical protein
VGDYLGDLAARSLNLVEIVQPRPVSLFAPAPVGGETQPRHIADLALGEDEPQASQVAAQALPIGAPPHWRPPAWPWASEPVVPRPPEGRSLDLIRRSQVPTRPVLAAESPEWPIVDRGPIEREPERTRPPEPGPPQPPVAAALSPQARTVPLPVPALPPEAPRPSRPLAESSVPPITGNQGAGTHANSVPQEHPYLLEPVIRRTVIEETVSRILVPKVDANRAPAGPASVRSAVREDGPIQPAPDRSKLEPVSSPVVPSRSLSEPPPSPTRLVMPPVQPRVIPAPPPEPAALIRPEPAPTPSPAVHVSIGRIEVRATPLPSAPQPRKRPSTPPVMSLDEYLRQRAHRGNR